MASSPISVSSQSKAESVSRHAFLLEAETAHAERKPIPDARIEFVCLSLCVAQEEVKGWIRAS